ncbi:uncharacterized protein Dlip3 isoform X1 [Bactrocera oleae]|uniref:uncharacterized protein Dlip3 isoform X1 n=2 Tax=Bactrocera oleae TaxID=104688 RepID=UPI00387E4A29
MRETYGPDFDDRLIRLVRDNPAIYDVNHEHYRRYQVRIAIWERIAAEMRTPSKFLQTKWKNIRYNYLQELKSLETGLANANIRKRRFTEDLSFLQNTAQSYKKVQHMNSSYNSSDNDSNSFMYMDPQNTSTFEIIEIEHSDDGSAARDHGIGNYNVDVAMPSQQIHENENTSLPTDNNDCYDDDQILTELNIPSKIVKSNKSRQDHTNQHKNISTPLQKADIDSSNMVAPMAPSSPSHSNASSLSSQLLTPIVILGKERNCENNILDPIPKQPETAAFQRQPSDIMTSASKRKSMPAPFPVLTPINDPIELYCLSLVDSLRNMPRPERERVKFEFAKILKDAKYKDQS